MSGSVRRLARAMSLALLLSVSLRAASPPSPPLPDDLSPPASLSAWVERVDELPYVGTVGAITVFGPRAWPLVEVASQTIVAAGLGAEKDSGRVVALAQERYLEPDTLGDASAKRFLAGACHWLARGKKKPRLFRPDRPVEEFAKKLGVRSARDLDSADVLVLTPEGLGLASLEGVRAFLAAGGGVLCAMTPHRWQNDHPGLSLARDCRLNRLTTAFGLVFDSRWFSQDDETGFAVVPPRNLSEFFHADRAFRALRSDETLEVRDGKLAFASVRAAATALTDFEPTLMVPMRRFAEEDDESPLAHQLALRFEDREKLHGLEPLDQRFGPWWLAGPFPAGDLHKEGLPLGKPLKIEGELERCTKDGPGPDLAHVWALRSGKSAWRPLEFEVGGEMRNVGLMNLRSILEGVLSERQRRKTWDEEVSVILYRSLELAKPGTLQLRLESTTPAEFYVDGAPVARILPEEERDGLDVELPLEAGRHHLWIRSSHADGSWGLRLSGPGDASRGQVEASIERGIERLAETQFIDGAWDPGGDWFGGSTALSLLALARCGIPREHPTVRLGLAYLDSRGDGETYTRALAREMRARAALDTHPEPFLTDAVERLAAAQNPSGLWGERVDPTASRWKKNLSNTYTVAFALREVSAGGVHVPDTVWKKLVEGVLACQDEELRPSHRSSIPLGFRNTREDEVTGSMTAAGVISLLAARDANGVKWSERERKEIDRAVSRGLAWLASHLRFDANPSSEEEHYLWIEELEQLAFLLDEPRLFGFDWYGAGSEYLVRRQGADGEWNAGHSVYDTPLALLFLSRASAAAREGIPERDWRHLHSDPAWREGRDAAAQELELTVHARRPISPGEELDCWLEYAGEGPSPTQVEWFASQGGDVVSLGTVDPGEDEGARHFRLRTQLPTPERVYVWATAKFASGKPLETFDVLIPRRFEEHEFELASLLEANLLDGAKVESSSNSGGWSPEDAIDGSCLSDWVADGEDEAPRWSAKLSDPVRASRLILVPYGPSPRWERLPRPTHVRITLNEGDAFEAELPTEPMHYQTVEFPEPETVHTLEIEILAGNFGRATGFSEIVLLP